MRLHLPKRLLHAVIASLVTASAALCTLGSAAYAGHANGVFYINPSETNTADSMAGYASFENGVYTYVNTDPTGKQAVTSIKPGSTTTGIITNLNVTSNKSLSFDKYDNKVFGILHISSVNIAAPDETTPSGAATFTFGSTNACHNVKINSVTGTLNVVNYSSLTFAGGESGIDLGAVTLNSGAITNTGTINLTGAVSMTEDYVKKNIAGTLGEGVVNGCGTVSSFALSDLFKGGGSVTGGDSVSWTMGDETLTYSNGSLSLGTALTSNIYQINDSSEGWELSGRTNVLIGGNTTVKLSSDTGKTPDRGTKITVSSGATLDVYGRACTACELVLDGGTLTNTGAEISAGDLQFKSVSLTGDSAISGSNSYGIVAANHGASLLALNGYTLTINGAFYGISTHITGGGTINISGSSSTLRFGFDQAGSGGFIDDANTTFCLSNGGALSTGSGKSIQLNVDTTFKAETAADVTNLNGVGTLSAAINTNGKVAHLSATKAQTGTDTTTGDTLKVTGVISGTGSISVSGAGTVELSGTNTYKGGTRLNDGHLTIGNASALGGNTDTEKQVLSFSGKSTLTVSTNTTLAATGKIQASADKAVLAINGNVNLTGQINVADAVGSVNITGGTTNLLGNDGRIWVKAGSSVTVSKSANLVTRVFSFTGNKDDSAGAISAIGNNKIEVVENANGSTYSNNTDYINTLFKDLDVQYTAADNRVIKANMDNVALSTTEGAGKITLSREGGVTLTGLTANSDIELSTATTVSGTTTIADGVEVSSSEGAKSGLGTLSGSGTLKASGGSTVSATNSSGFSGTLEASGTDTALNATGGLGRSLKAAKASDGAAILLQGNQDTSTISVEEVVIAGAASITAFNEILHPIEVMASKVQIGAGGGSLSGNLSINAGGTLTLDASAGATIEQGGTKGLSTTGSLTLGSDLTLDLLNLGKLTTDDSLKLFSGVTSLTFTQLNESGVGTSTTATDAITTGAIDASTVFSGLGKDDFWLTYTGSANGGVVSLVAQRDVPEPTTATLSLLSLMGLAARRRRRKA